jgi:hypothetical protein
MDQFDLFRPPCSRLLTDKFVESFPKLFLQNAQLADSIAAYYRKLDPEESESWDAKARHNRELVWSILPGDRFWITVDESSHPEVDCVVSFVVVRGGTVVFKERLGAF